MPLFLHSTAIVTYTKVKIPPLRLRLIRLCAKRADRAPRGSRLEPNERRTRGLLFTVKLALVKHLVCIHVMRTRNH